MDFYLSLEVSKKLKEWGCDLEADIVYINGSICHKRQDDLYTQIKTYHILEDVCIKYRKQFFGNGLYIDYLLPKKIKITWMAYEYHSKNILLMLQQDKKEEVEQYILDNTIFNPKNK